MAIYDEKGREVPDPRPVEWPAGMKRPETMQETMRRIIQQELSQRAEAAGAESFEDANDFDVEDEDPELVTHHEFAAMEPELAFGRDADQEVIDAPAGGSMQGGSPPAATVAQKPSGEASGATNAPPSTLQSIPEGDSKAMQVEKPK